MTPRTPIATIEVVPAGPRARKDFLAILLVDHIRYKGWGSTPETAVMDAFAVWRVMEKRKVGRAMVLSKLKKKK